MSGAVAALLLLAFMAAPLYASQVAHTTPSANHLTDQITVDGRETDVVSIDGVPIGPQWFKADGRYVLGADENGRDLMVRVLYGGRASLVIGASAILVTLLFAIPLALTAGFFRGRTDAIVLRLLDLIWSFPALLLGVLLSTAISLHGIRIGPLTVTSGSKLIPIMVIGVVYVPYLARPLRGQVLTLREQPFVEAARASGLGPGRVMASELLPHLWSTILALSTLLFANAVVLEAALSFLGAGINPPEPSFGTLIAAGLDDTRLSPHLLLAPSVALVLVVLSFSALGESLRRALDPHSAIAVDIVHGQ